jgi:hypothetical protein
MTKAVPENYTIVDQALVIISFGENVTFRGVNRGFREIQRLLYSMHGLYSENAFLIPNLFILDFSVEGGIFKTSAAPPLPQIFPLHFFKTRRM